MPHHPTTTAIPRPQRTGSPVSPTSPTTARERTARDSIRACGDCGATARSWCSPAIRSPTESARWWWRHSPAPSAAWCRNCGSPRPMAYQPIVLSTSTTCTPSLAKPSAKGSPRSRRTGWRKCAEPCKPLPAADPSERKWCHRARYIATDGADTPADAWVVRGRSANRTRWPLHAGHYGRWAT